MTTASPHWKIHRKPPPPPKTSRGERHHIWWHAQLEEYNPFFFFMCLEMLSCFCIFAPVINTRADLSITDWQIKAACQKGQGTCACLNRCQRRGCKRKARLICSPGLRGFKHINPIKGSDKPIPSSPLKMWVMRTLAAVYGMIIIYATT